MKKPRKKKVVAKPKKKSAKKDKIPRRLRKIYAEADSPMPPGSISRIYGAGKGYELNKGGKWNKIK